MAKYYYETSVVLFTSAAKKNLVSTHDMFRKNVDAIYDARNVNEATQKRVAQFEDSMKGDLDATYSQLDRAKDKYSDYVEKNGIPSIKTNIEPVTETIQCTSLFQNRFLGLLSIFDDVVLLLEAIHFQHPHTVDSKHKNSVIKSVLNQFRYLATETKEARSEIKELTEQHIDGKKLSVEQRMLSRTPKPMPLEVPQID